MAKPSPNALSEPIQILRPGLAIYRVNASPYWMARIWIPSEKRNKVRSTKETSKVKARQAAEDLAQDLLSGIKTVKREFSFEYYADRLIRAGQTRIDRGERNANYVRTIKLCIVNPEWGLMPAFRGKDVREIKTRQYQEYIEDVRRRRPDLKSSTLNSISATLRNVLKLARDDGAIDSIPSTPRTPQKDSPRSRFDFYPLVSKQDDKYQKLLRAAKALADDEKKVRGVRITAEMRDLIIFVVHSFVRPTTSELFALKHRDVSVAGDEPRRLLINVRTGKTGRRISNTMEAAVSVFERIKLRNPDSQPSDFLFFPEYENRTTAGRIAARQFKEVMDKAGIENDPSTGEKYSLYSLRHTAICMRLINSKGKVNIYSLAKNAGTSVDQIERFYAKQLPLTGDLVKNLHSFGD
ncbi:hypothetical protein [Sphingopyxis sp.]|uniref:hypothetical protein n=1 Tax=Sphingopyxis sp. TaxID=1908224 RepID=UPI003D6D4949